MIRFAIRMTIFGAIIIYIFPDMPVVIASSLGNAVGEFMASLQSSFMEGVTPQWAKDLKDFMKE